MSQFVETPTRAFVAAAARAQYLRVYLSGTTLTTATEAIPSIGTQERESFAAADVVPVRLRTAQGTRKCVASDVIVAGAAVYAAAGGKVAPTGTVVEGIALEAAGANNDVIEVMDIPNTDIATAITGTTAAAFEVDSDSATPKIKLAGQAAGTGDFTTTLVPESTLSADNTIIVPEANGDTLAAVALAQTLSGKTISDALQFIAGAATPAVALRLGDTATEGLEIKVYEEVITLTNAVTTNTTLAVPAGAVVLSAQVNLDTAVVGDASGDNLLAKVGLGITGTVVKYGVTSGLTKNLKIDTIPDWAVNAGETLALFGVKADGTTACTEKFVGGELVRVRVVFAVCNSLDNAA